MLCYDMLRFPPGRFVALAATQLLLQLPARAGLAFTQRLGSEHVDDDMYVFAANVLQTVGLALRGAVSMLWLFGPHFWRRGFCNAWCLHAKNWVALLQQPQALGLLQRRCDRCILLLSADCLVRTPGLTTEVGGATTCLCSGGLCGPVLHRPRALVAAS